MPQYTTVGGYPNPDPYGGDDEVIDAEILTCAKYYARASAVRAVYGVIPDCDPKADQANWTKTLPGIRTSCVAMVKGIFAARKRQPVRADEPEF